MAATLDGVLVQWGERLFYPGNRRTSAVLPGSASASLRQRAQIVRRHIAATVVRKAPQVMVKVTGGGRGMAAIAAHFRYISKGGRLEFTDDRGVIRAGKDALHDLADQWRFGGERVPEVSHRREAFNIMLSMPSGTDPTALHRAARDFARDELANHRYVTVLHTHQAHPHVHLSVRAAGRDGKRLNPRKEDLHRWRAAFAERLRGLGIEAEASAQATRGVTRRSLRVWEQQPQSENGPRRRGLHKSGPATRATRASAIQAWAEISKALAASADVEDHQLSAAVADFVMQTDVARAVRHHRAAQQHSKRLGAIIALEPSAPRARPEPAPGTDLSR